MPRGQNRRKGVGAGDYRRGGLGKSSAVTPSPTFFELATSGRDAVYNLLRTNDGIDETTEGLATEARNAVNALLTANVLG